MLTIVFLSAYYAITVAATAEGNAENFDLFPSLPFGAVDTDNILCRDQSRLYVEHLKNLSLWAYAMHDATAKSVTGLLRGSISQFGHFEECLTSKAPFETQYCLTTITANIPEPHPKRDAKSLDYEPNESVLRKIYNKMDPSQQPENIVLMGWCIPASCREEDLQTYLNTYFDNLQFRLKKYNVTYSAQITADGCQTKDDNKQYDHADYSFSLVVIILATLVVSSSTFDYLRNSSEDKLKIKTQFTKLLLTFSIRKNYNKLPYADGSNSSLKILYGIRVICICMIITDHRFGTHLASAVLNFNLVEEQYRSSLGTLFFHGDLFVDTFFILSGLLVTYCLLIQYDKRFTNPGLIIFMRYVRLTPLYAFVIFYYATLLQYTGSGPMWKSIIGPEVQDCRKNWWTNVLYISNYINVDHMCMVHSWYLPCDFHYFIFAVLICIFIHKSKRLGLVFLGLSTLGSIVIPFTVGVIYQLPAVIFFYPDFLRMPKQQDEFILSYSKSHTRSAPYFIGMIAGYLYYRMKESEKCLKKVYSHIILIISLGLMAGSIVTGMFFYDPNYEYNAVESALYAALHRAVWAIGSIGVFYVASYGNAQLLYKFLSWKPWVPLSKLVYGAYLVHMQFQLRSVAKKAGADVVTYYDIITFALSDIVLAFGTSFVLYLAVEAPFRNIFTLLLVPEKEVQPKMNNPADTKEDVSETTVDSHL